MANVTDVENLDFLFTQNSHDRIVHRIRNDSHIRVSTPLRNFKGTDKGLIFERNFIFAREEALLLGVVDVDVLSFP